MNCSINGIVCHCLPANSDSSTRIVASTASFAIHQRHRLPLFASEFGQQHTSCSINGVVCHCLPANSDSSTRAVASTASFAIVCQRIRTGAHELLHQWQLFASEFGQQHTSCSVNGIVCHCLPANSDSSTRAVASTASFAIVCQRIWTAAHELLHQWQLFASEFGQQHTSCSVNGIVCHCLPANSDSSTRAVASTASFAIVCQRIWTAAHELLHQWQLFASEFGQQHTSCSVNGIVCHCLPANSDSSTRAVASTASFAIVCQRIWTAAHELLHQWQLFASEFGQQHTNCSINGIVCHCLPASSDSSTRAVASTASFAIVCQRIWTAAHELLHQWQLFASEFGQQHTSCSVNGIVCHCLPANSDSSTRAVASTASFAIVCQRIWTAAHELLHQWQLFASEFGQQHTNCSINGIVCHCLPASSDSSTRAVASTASFAIVCQRIRTAAHEL
ncbi:unnamed protein product [Cylicocyclus nassatus]|uniref:Uncharacterized protein n=1 Tax=Cylicocyclus nassatus TaxID=53992 RepID=A0AA36H210_CYLNA|nr:unnamed protein product [Cylicocyclus nassatus]